VRYIRHIYRLVQIHCEISAWARSIQQLQFNIFLQCCDTPMKEWTWDHFHILAVRNWNHLIALGKEMPKVGPMLFQWFPCQIRRFYRRSQDFLWNYIMLLRKFFLCFIYTFKLLLQLSCLVHSLMMLISRCVLRFVSCCFPCWICVYNLHTSDTAHC